VLQKAKKAYASWLTIAGNIPKAQRYSLGGKIDDQFLELLEEIFTALYLPIEKKVGRIDTAIVKLDGVKFFTQLCWENKYIPHRQYGELSLELSELGKILGGWRKGLENKTLAARREKA
jgi:hypothetical protein